MFDNLAAVVFVGLLSTCILVLAGAFKLLECTRGVWVDRPVTRFVPASTATSIVWENKVVDGRLLLVCAIRVSGGTLVTINGAPAMPTDNFSCDFSVLAPGGSSITTNSSLSSS